MIIENLKPLMDLLEEESKNKNSVIDITSKVPKIEKGILILFGD